MEEITREKILSYKNVPVSIAAKYIGISYVALFCALRQNKFPFGCAIESSKRPGRYRYQISPGLLVAYQEGTISL